MSPTFTDLDVLDLRYPTSVALDGSDAMNPDPDYSAAYVIARTDADDGLEGHGFTFTIGRGNDLVVQAIHALKPFLIGREVNGVMDDLGAFARTITGDSQLRWIGPEKGTVHLAGAAVINAVWDLRARQAGLPLWRLLLSLEPAEVAALIDFRYISDEITPDSVEETLRNNAAGRKATEDALLTSGLRAYSTSAGWIGYDDDKIRRLCREAMADGFRDLKMKVGANHADDLRGASILREELGSDHGLMMDANQVWDVDVAIERMAELGQFNPIWIEEPTSPDDILGHARIADAVRPVGVATGEHVHNRVMFKQLLQAGAISYCQIDSARLAGVNEVIAVLFLAEKFGVPVCPHAGGVGLCEYVQHLSAFDAIAVAPKAEGRVVEYVDHLHEHFLDPVVIRNGAYVLPEAAGYSAEIYPSSRAEHSYPDGQVWRARLAHD